MESDLSIRIKLPNGAEVELRGNGDAINKALNDLPSLVSKVQTAFGFEETRKIATKESKLDRHPLEEYPVIERPSGSQDGILKVLKTSWGMVKPRNWREINAMLKHNAVHLSEGSVTGALTLMVQAGKLRRVTSEGSYAYTLPLNASAPS